jgi:hypothetical protein
LKKAALAFVQTHKGIVASISVLQKVKAGNKHLASSETSAILLQERVSRVIQADT